MPARTAPHIGDTIISMAIMISNMPAIIPNALDPPLMRSGSQAMNHSSYTITEQCNSKYKQDKYSRA